MTITELSPIQKDKIMQRLLSHVEIQPDGCWMWKGAKHQRDGYGHMNLAGHLIMAHRVSYELHRGAIPDGLVLDHLCRIRLCVNPEHLEPVTNHVNVLRGKVGSKTHCARGHPFDEENTMYRYNGSRGCRICRRAERRRYYQRVGN